MSESGQRPLQNIDHRRVQTYSNEKFDEVNINGSNDSLVRAGLLEG